MGLDLVTVTIDADDVAAVAGFWAEALGWRHDGGGADWAYLAPAAGSGLPRICVQRVPEGKVAKNRVHLDLRVRPGATFDRERARLESLGAGTVRLHGTGPGIRHWQMADPEGNEFCLVDLPTQDDVPG